MTTEDIQPGVQVRHKKGTTYTILGIGEHTETGGKFVAYQAHKDGKIWLRPVDTFLDTGRFEIIEGTQPHLCFQHGGSCACEEKNKQRNLICPKCKRGIGYWTGPDESPCQCHDQTPPH